LPRVSSWTNPKKKGRRLRGETPCGWSLWEKTDRRTHEVRGEQKLGTKKDNSKDKKKREVAKRKTMTFTQMGPAAKGGKDST